MKKFLNDMLMSGNALLDGTGDGTTESIKFGGIEFTGEELAILQATNPTLVEKLGTASHSYGSLQGVMQEKSTLQKQVDELTAKINSQTQATQTKEVTKTEPTEGSTDVDAIINAVLQKINPDISQVKEIGWQREESSILDTFKQSYGTEDSYEKVMEEYHAIMKGIPVENRSADLASNILHSARSKHLQNPLSGLNNKDSLAKLLENPETKQLISEILSANAGTNLPNMPTGGKPNVINMQKNFKGKSDSELKKDVLNRISLIGK